MTDLLPAIDNMIENIITTLEDMAKYMSPQDVIELRNRVLSLIHNKVTKSPAPVDDVQRIPHEKVVANDYNPNSVANKELKLLYTSIKEDWYTQPIVTIYDEDRDLYVIVDGFHRYFVMRMNKDIYDLYHGHLPCVVIKKDINQRMASTVRHNRARGHHSVDGMGNLVYQMLANGWSDEVICNKLWLEVEELLRLKHITGFSKLFENTEYSKSRETEQQIEHKRNFFTKGEVEEVEIEEEKEDEEV